MRVLLVNKPYYPVPPLHYGGVERIVDALARGLKARGHLVTLLGHVESQCTVEVAPWKTTESHTLIGRVRSALEVGAIAATGDFDLIHCHAAVSAVLLPAIRGVPVVTTFHLPIHMRTLRYVRMLRRSRVHFTSPSKTMIAAVHGEAEVEHIPNFVELDRFPFAASVPENAPIVMMGRIDEQKGVHVGIEAARRAGQKLIIAGTVDSGSVRYFEEKVKPHIDNEHVRYVGPVDDRQKAQLLGAAAAFMLPAQWEEPFGIVMLEAMSCGTPVIGLKRGEIPEIIAHGKTGFIANDVDDIVRQLDMVRGIDRQECRLAVERKYSSDAIVDRYVDYFRTVLRSGRSPMMDESLPSRRPF